MMDIVRTCVKMLDILTDMYEKDSLTKEEYIEHTAIKAAFLAERLGGIIDARDRKRATELLKTCQKISDEPVIEARY